MSRREAFDVLKKIVNESRTLLDGGAELRGVLSKREYDVLGDMMVHFISGWMKQ